MRCTTLLSLCSLCTGVLGHSNTSESLSLVGYKEPYYDDTGRMYSLERDPEKEAFKPQANRAACRPAEENYPPAFCPIVCGCGVFFNVQFLYWYANENELPYVLEGQVLSSGGTSSDRYGFAEHAEYINTRWQPGVRVGIGYNGVDGWDQQLEWTYYKNTAKNSTSTENFLLQVPEVGNSYLFDIWSMPIFSHSQLGNQASANWEFTINYIDVVMGQRFWLSPCFTLRPYASVRAAWTKTKFSVVFSKDPFQSEEGNLTELARFTNTNAFENNNWAVGINGGIDAYWSFFECFGIYGSFSGALLWGKQKLSKESNLIRELSTDSGVIYTALWSLDPSYCDSVFNMQPVLDAGIGLRYETNFCSSSYYFALDAGWEHHTYFSLNHRYRQYAWNELQGQVGTQVFSVNNGYTYDSTKHDVSFGGFVLRARFDF